VTTNNPWDKVFFQSIVPDTSSPKAILLKYVENFNNSQHRNPNIIAKVVTTSLGETQFKHAFYLTAASIQYTTLIFYVVNKLNDLYPATFHIPNATGDSFPMECKDNIELNKTIEDFITSAAIIKLVNGLIKTLGTT